MNDRKRGRVYVYVLACREGGGSRKEGEDRQENSGAAATITAKILTNGIST